MLEETGLDVEIEPQPIGCWESCYPTFRSKSTDPLKAHFLALYFLAFINEEKEIVMQASEVDAYCWLDISELETILKSNTNNSNTTNKTNNKTTNNETNTTTNKTNMMMKTINKNEKEELSLDDIGFGVYPNNKNSGIAQGHEFIIRKVLEEYCYNNNNNNTSKI